MPKSDDLKRYADVAILVGSGLEKGDQNLGGGYPLLPLVPVSVVPSLIQTYKSALTETGQKWRFLEKM